MRFTEIEVAIRDNFDQFLSYFERFEHFIEAKLITREELSPYVIYWINTIANDLEILTKQALFAFIQEYGYNNVQNFFMRFDKNICIVRKKVS